ncbi:MAG: hypothetical protein IPK83_15885 [Planctomycetes bacterium]|nr:hypothetical protein [Planctomycetota bacterium]
MEIDPYSGTLYFADHDHDRILRCNLDGSGVVVLIQGQPQPIDLALDLVGGKLYWTDNVQDKILRSNLDCTQLETFHTVISPGQYAPFSIAFDYIARRIYWSEDEWILSARTDGTDQREETNGGGWPVSGIAIDPLRRTLFWSVSGFNSGSIHSKSLDDDRRRTLYTTPLGNHNVADVELDLTRREILWADAAAGTIERCRYDGSERITLLSTGLSPGGLAIDYGSTPVLPSISAIESLPGGSSLVRFGYLNGDAFARTIPIGIENQISTGPSFQGQPTEFLPGRHDSVFAIEYSGTQPQWRLEGCETGGIDCDDDGSTDECEPDWDGDLTIDDCDNCPDVVNADQSDSDGDGWGDACDACPDHDDAQDSDNDFVPDGCDLCPGPDSNDDDHDITPNNCDNCPQDANFAQVDSDGDGVGDACDHCPGFDDAVDADLDGFIDGCTPCEILPDAYFSPPTGIENAEFATAVAMHGDVLVLGAPGSDYNACGAEGSCLVGSAVVFRRIGDEWSDEAILSSSENVESDLFGFSVAVEDSLIVVGAPRANLSPSSPYSARGAVFVFRREAGAWNLESRLASIESTGSDRFGTAVAISDGRIAVGNPSESTNGLSNGSVHLYEYVDGDWVRVQRLANSTDETSDHFGAAVALDGPNLIVGAPWTNGETDTSGAAYLFRLDDVQWSLLSRVEPRSGQSALEFGQSVDIHNEMAVVASPDEWVLFGGEWVTSAGAIYVYERTGATWTESARITEQLPRWPGYFGASVAINNGTLVTITGPYGTINGSGNAAPREVHVLQRRELAWETRAVLANPPMRTSSSIINAVAINEGRIVVGQPISADYPPFPDVAFLYHSVSDCDTNGVIDACQGTPPPDCTYPGRGDLNQDGIVGLADVTWFVHVLLTSNGGTSGWTTADMNHDSRIDGRDIAPFVTAILTP